MSFGVFLVGSLVFIVVLLLGAAVLSKLWTTLDNFNDFLKRH